MQPSNKGHPARAEQGGDKNKTGTKTRAKTLPGLTLVRVLRDTCVGCQTKEDTILPFFILISQFSYSHL